MLFKPGQFPSKTDGDYKELSKIATDTNKSSHGIKGPSVFSATLKHQITKKVPFDAMHLIFEGHTKFILKRLVPKFKFISKIFNFN